MAGICVAATVGLGCAILIIEGNLGEGKQWTSIWPYPICKPSGVPWLGDMPRSWEVRRIKTLFQESEDRRGQRPMGLLSLTRAKLDFVQTIDK